MAIHESCRSITGEAGSAITKFRFVNMASDGQYDHVATGQLLSIGCPDGISAEAQATVGAAFALVVPDGGIAKVEAGGAITRGALITSDTSGRAVAFTAGTPNRHSCGRAQAAATGAGEVISIQFMHKLSDGT